MVGLAAATFAGLRYLLSLRFVNRPAASVAILLAGRTVLGGAESFIITGATTWGLIRAGANNAGKVIAWMGTAMFTAFAAGAPLGTLLYGNGGFGAVALATAMAPLATLLLIAPLQAAAPAQKPGPSILSVVSRIWLPGFGAALSSVGYGAIIAFSSNPSSSSSNAFMRRCTGLGVCRRIIAKSCARCSGERIAPLMPISASKQPVPVKAPRPDSHGVGGIPTGLKFDSHDTSWPALLSNPRR